MIIETQCEFPENDSRFDECLITGVDSGEKGWSVTRDDDWSCWISSDSPVIPKVGMSIRCYTQNSSSIRGIFLDGVKVFYRTEDEQRQIWADETAKKNAANEARAARERPDRDKRWAAFRRSLLLVVIDLWRVIPTLPEILKHTNYFVVSRQWLSMMHLMVI